MREIARLLLKVREKSSEHFTLKKVLCPSMFDDVVEAVKEECKYSISKGTAVFEIPSLALKIGQTLRKCCYIKLGICIKEKDTLGEKEAEKFLQLLSMEFSERVSSIALKTLQAAKQKSPQCLPLTEDIVHFQSFIKDKLVRLTNMFNRAEDNMNYSKQYSELARAALARMITFNKRRSGECAKIFVSDFQSRQVSDNKRNEDIVKMLCPSEQKLASRLQLINIKGKRDRTVPVILTSDQFEALKLLSIHEIREKAGIAKDNDYMFPVMRGSLNNMRGCDALNEVVKEAGLKQPDAFKSTRLRKYIATVSQVLNMDENELDWLANHLGHDIRVHRSYYRLQSEQIELAKISKLLIAVDSGRTHELAGKKLDNIQIEDLDDVMDAVEEDEDQANAMDSVEEDEDQANVMDSVEEGEGQANVMDSVEEGEGQAEHLDEIASGEKGQRMPGKKQQKKLKANPNGKRCIHRAWEQKEKEFVMNYFKTNIVNRKINGIGKKQLEEATCIKKGGNILKNRTWVQVKSCLKNIITRIERQGSRGILI